VNKKKKNLRTTTVVIAVELETLKKKQYHIMITLLKDNY